jgi:hypothetical protein
MYAVKRDETKLEKLIRTVWRETKKGKDIRTDEQNAVVAAIALTLRHFEEEDRVYGTIHAEIFKEVYLSNDLIAQKTYDARKLLCEAEMNIVFDENGYSISPYNFEIVPAGSVHGKRKDKPLTEMTRAAYALRVGVCTRTLNRYISIYLMQFDKMLEDVGFNNVASKPIK